MLPLSSTKSRETTTAAAAAAAAASTPQMNFTRTKLVRKRKHELYVPTPLHLRALAYAPLCHASVYAT